MRHFQSLTKTTYGRTFLKALSEDARLNQQRNKKIFISYAWAPGEQRAQQQANLTVLAEDLRALGFEFFWTLIA